MKADERLTEIRERTKAATPGPWGRYGTEEKTAWESTPSQWVGSAANTEPIARVNGYMLPLRANVEFIMCAREDIPWLLARIAELERLVPDAALLETAAMFSRRCSAIHLPGKLMQYAAAIRKYGEE